MLLPWSTHDNYVPVPNAEHGESHLKSPMTWSNRLALRRLRSLIVVVVFFALLFVLSQFSSLPQQIHGFPPTNSTPAVIPQRPDDSTPETADAATNPEPAVPWSDYAYVQYVTNEHYLCNSLMILESLHRLEAKADRIMMYPEQWVVPGANATDAVDPGKLLAQARDLYGTKLVPIQVKTFRNAADPTWQDSYTKLLAFNQTQYKRVISLDSDATVRQHMDELFLLPSAPVAMPRAYWMGKYFLSSQLIVIEPSEFEWKRVEDAMEHHEGNDYDMDILNKLYGSSCMVIPHRKYDLITGEFISSKHESYLGSHEEQWDPRKALAEAKFVHFSDWPLPKPWLKPSPEQLEKQQPKCVGDGEQQDCSDRDVWLEIRNDFHERRQRVCGHTWDKKRKIRRRSS